MNFLAHIALSGENIDRQLGNFLGDFVVGDLNHPRNNFLNTTHKAGVLLHREIDRFTDNHATVRISTHRLMPKYHKFSGIIVDVFYDHFLAKNWKKYYNADLPQFIQHFYTNLKILQPQLPRALDRPFQSMFTYNWLLNYGNFEGIEWTLKGISKRTTFDSGMENAIEDLKTDYHLYEADFFSFYPELMDFCNEKVIV